MSGNVFMSNPFELRVQSTLHILENPLNIRLRKSRIAKHLSTKLLPYVFAFSSPS